MKLMSIASGSSGNCIFAGSEKTSVLIDVGISRKRIAEGLHTINMDFGDLDAILLTHEHIDHVRALGVLSRSCGIPLYATRDTFSEVCKMSVLGDIDKGLFHVIEPDIPFLIGDMSVVAHTTWHDAADPVCYCLHHQSKKICIATDMGDYDEYLIQALADADALLLESNHDIRMLQVGTYPYALKQRILGARGHLSNEACGRLLRSVLNNHIKYVCLGHLSKENNYPELAYETVKTELIGNAYFDDVRDIRLSVASRTEVGQCIDV